MRVGEIMRTPVVCVKPETDLKRASVVLTRNGFVALPVVGEQGGIMGMISETDIVRDRLTHGRSRRRTVREAITRKVFTTTVTAEVLEVATAMLEHGVRVVPVVTERGEVVGIVGERDVTRALTQDDGGIAAQVRYRLDDYWGPGRRWDVEVDDGLVTVTGEFRDEAERAVVRRLADIIPGISTVATKARDAIRLCD